MKPNLKYSGGFIREDGPVGHNVAELLGVGGAAALLGLDLVTAYNARHDLPQALGNMVDFVGATLLNTAHHDNAEFFIEQARAALAKAGVQ